MSGPGRATRRRLSDGAPRLLAYLRRRLTPLAPARGDVSVRTERRVPGEHEHARLRGVAQVRQRVESGVAEQFATGLGLFAEDALDRRAGRLARDDADDPQFIDDGLPRRGDVFELLRLARLQVDRFALRGAGQARRVAVQDRFADERERGALAVDGDAPEDD